MNRISAILDPDIGWVPGPGDGETALAQSIEDPCGCASSWWLFSRTLTWTPSIDWICERHARVTK